MSARDEGPAGDEVIWCGIGKKETVDVVVAVPKRALPWRFGKIPRGW